jgi:hypothetical protein
MKRTTSYKVLCFVEKHFTKGITSREFRALYSLISCNWNIHRDTGTYTRAFSKTVDTVKMFAKTKHRDNYDYGDSVTVEVEFGKHTRVQGFSLLLGDDQTTGKIMAEFFEKPTEHGGLWKLIWVPCYPTSGFLRCQGRFEELLTQYRVKHAQALKQEDQEFIDRYESAMVQLDDKLEKGVRATRPGVTEYQRKMIEDGLNRVWQEISYALLSAQDNLTLDRATVIDCVLDRMRDDATTYIPDEDVAGFFKSMPYDRQMRLAFGVFRDSTYMWPTLL